MPDLTIVFKNVGLIVNSAPSRMLMLHEHHQTTLVTPTGKTRTLTGGIKITIRTGGQVLSGQSKAPDDNRLVKLKKALKKKQSPPLRPEAEIKKLINTEVIVPQGKWKERDPQFKLSQFEIYKNEKWKFDSAGPKPHKQKLTNIVEHISKLDKAESYGLYVGEELIETFAGKQDHSIEVRNDDQYPSDYQPYSGELEDFQEIFSLLVPLEKPFPKVLQTSGNIPPGAGWTRPICPMGQVD
jgi:hypothetical protein